MAVPSAGKRSLVKRSEEVLVDPANRGHTDGVRETEKQLVSGTFQRKVRDALEPAVLQGRHPSHPQLAVFHRHDDLPAAPAPHSLRLLGN